MSMTQSTYNAFAIFFYSIRCVAQNMTISMCDRDENIDDGSLFNSSQPTYVRDIGVSVERNFRQEDGMNEVKKK